jgi:membrane peptidoglycan carboxypeptidase
VGYTCKVTAAVWVGNVGGPGQEIAPLGGMGGTLAAPTWAEFMTRLNDNGLVQNDCTLAEVTDFPGRTTFEDREVTDSSSQPTCPAGYVPSDDNGDGIVDSCYEAPAEEPTPTTAGTVPPPTTAPPPPPTTAPPPPPTTAPAPPGRARPG